MPNGESIGATKVTLAVELRKGRQCQGRLPVLAASLPLDGDL